MTQLGRIQREFYEFREEVLSRLEALEAAKDITPSSRKVSKSKKSKEDNEVIVMETKEDEIVGTEVPFEFN